MLNFILTSELPPGFKSRIVLAVHLSLGDLIMDDTTRSTGLTCNADRRAVLVVRRGGEVCARPDPPGRGIGSARTSPITNPPCLASEGDAREQQLHLRKKNTRRLSVLGRISWVSMQNPELVFHWRCRVEDRHRGFGLMTSQV